MTPEQQQLAALIAASAQPKAQPQKPKAPKKQGTKKKQGMDIPWFIWMPLVAGVAYITHIAMNAQ